MNRWNILNHYLKCKMGTRFSSRAALEEWQRHKITAHLNEMYEKCRYFQRQQLRVEDWQNWPVMKKKTWMNDFDELNTVGISKQEAFACAVAAEESRDFAPTLRGVTVGLSSGTSGSRGIFLVSDREREQWVGTILAKVLPKPIWVKQKVGFFFRANSNLYEAVTSKQIQFRFFDLMKPLEQHWSDLNAFQPDILVAPPSALGMIASAIQQHKLTLAPIKVISVAEVLEPHVKLELEATFQQAIHQIYQCTEGFLAHTCTYGTLHLNEDVVYVEKEWLSTAEGKFAPIITDFTRRTQALVRYRLDDLLTVKRERCPCGSIFTALESIEGRCDDVFYLPISGDEAVMKGGRVPVFPDFIRRWIISQALEVKEYRVIQRSLTEWVVSLELRADSERESIQRALLDSLVSLCRAWQAVPPVVEFTYGIEHNPTVKLRRVIREWKMELE